MLEFFKDFFWASGQFIPHGHCYLWKPELVWLHILSDSLIALAYYSIPITLVYFVRKRVDWPFNWMVLLFGSFIIACGTTHVMEIWTLWHPAYWLSGLLKLITALVSIYTAQALVLLVPKALALPSTAQLEKANSELEREITERKLVEETLRESEERFRSAFDYAAIGMAIVALDGSWLQVNHSLCEIVGYSEQELLSTTFQAITHPDDLDSDLNYVRQLLSGEIRTYQMEKRYFHKLGHVVWILLSASLVRDTQGQPLYFISQIQDITDRKRVEEELRKSEERWQLVLLSTNDGIWDRDLITNQDFLSSQGQEMLGYLDNEVNHFDKWVTLIHPSDLDAMISAVQTHLNRQTPHYVAEYRMRCADGKYKWILSRGLALWDEAGKPVRIVGSITDISDRKQAQEVLQESEARLRLALEAAQMGTWDWNILTDEVVYSDQLASVLGLPRGTDHPTYEAFLNSIHPKDHEYVAQALARAVREGANYALEFRVIWPDGTLHWVGNNGQVYCDETGKPLRMLGVAWDITDRKIAEKRLRILERAIAASKNGIIISDAQAPDNPAIYINSGFERITGYTPSDIIGKNCRILQGIDKKQPALEQLRFALSSGRETQVVLRNYRKDGTLFWNELCLTPLRDGKGRLTHFIGIQTDITERKQAEEVLQQQFLREQLVGSITQHIRQSLNLEEILDATVTQVRQVLQADRVLVYRLWSEGTRSVVTEAVVPGCQAILGEAFSEEIFPQEFQRQYCQGQIYSISNVEHAELSPCLLEFLQQFGVKAKMVVPILQGEQLWGWLVAHQCSETRQWQQFEINLLGQLAAQVAIAIQQSQLYKQAQSHAQQLEQALQELQQTQAQLVHSEKMSSLGQLVAGVTHEINNPVGFIYANTQPAMEYAQNLLHLIQLYRQHYPEPVAEITEQLEFTEPDFIAEDFPKLLASIKEGANRISNIVMSLRNFSRLDETGFKRVDIHEGINNTLFILQHRLKQQCNRPEVQVIKTYGSLPKIECCPGQLNQVFMNILCNAIDALDQVNDSKFFELKVVSWKDNLQPALPCIWIHTEVVERDWVTIRITDNGFGIPAEVQPRIFDPFFTTKPVGSGTGLGLSISYQIVVDVHSGKLWCHSVAGQGTEFVIKLPIVSC